MAVNFLGHSEEISTLAIQNDCQVIASASGCAASDVTNQSAASSSHLSNVISQLIVWDVHTCTCKKLLRHRCHQITCLAFSRDDRFLVAISEQSTLDRK